MKEAAKTETAKPRRRTAPPAPSAPGKPQGGNGTGGKQAAAQQGDAESKRDEGPDQPLLDGVTASVKKMIARGKDRGYVTYDELNAALPSDQVSSEQIEDTMAMLSDMGINVVEDAAQSVESSAGSACSSPRSSSRDWA